MGAETDWLRSVGTEDLFSAIGEPQTGPFLSPEAAGRPPRGDGVLAEAALQAVKAAPVETHAGMTVIAAFRSIALACLDHLQSNEQGLQESDHPEFVHQARVAIRRLRSAIRVWKARLPPEFVARFDPVWQALARHLGETRNWDVFVAETLPAIAAAFSEGVEIACLADYAHRRGASHRQAARRALNSDAYSRMLLEFTAAVRVLPDSAARPLDVFAPRCLDKRARQVSELAAQAVGSDAAARHRLRVSYKRLRYALEFFAPLFPSERLRHYHLAASRLQEMLGQLNDLAVAVELSSEALSGEQGEVVRCWLAGQTERLLPELGELLSDFRQQAVPWRLPAG